jgi:hypothetical protein
MAIQFKKEAKKREKRDGNRHVQTLFAYTTCVLLLMRIPTLPLFLKNSLFNHGTWWNEPKIRPKAFKIETAVYPSAQNSGS